MKQYVKASMYELWHGDCIDVMKSMPESSVDAIVTDPPYGISFMGKQWDHGIPGVLFWAEALRVAKPGAIMLAFGGTRTYHRLVCAIEDAGFEIRDCIQWIYGSGFPKSLDISKAIDKAAGAEREVVGEYTARGFSNVSPTEDGRNQWAAGEVTDKVGTRTTPTTDAAKTWNGYGTSLKPAHEPICVAMKPLSGTYAQNAIEHGVAGINVDGCRVGTEEKLGRPYGGDNEIYGKYSMERGTRTGDNLTGRWPANIILTYPEDSYKLRDDVTPSELRELAEWMDENPEL